MTKDQETQPPRTTGQENSDESTNTTRKRVSQAAARRKKKPQEPHKTVLSALFVGFLLLVSAGIYAHQKGFLARSYGPEAEPAAKPGAGQEGMKVPLVPAPSPEAVKNGRDPKDLGPGSKKPVNVRAQDRDSVIADLQARVTALQESVTEVRERAAVPSSEAPLASETFAQLLQAVDGLVALVRLESNVRAGMPFQDLLRGVRPLLAEDDYEFLAAVAPFGLVDLKALSKDYGYLRRQIEAAAVKPEESQDLWARVTRELKKHVQITQRRGPQEREAYRLSLAGLPRAIDRMKDARSQFPGDQKRAAWIAHAEAFVRAHKIISARIDAYREQIAKARRESVTQPPLVMRRPAMAKPQHEKEQHTQGREALSQPPQFSRGPAPQIAAPRAGAGEAGPKRREETSVPAALSQLMRLPSTLTSGIFPQVQALPRSKSVLGGVLKGDVLSDERTGTRSSPLHTAAGGAVNDFVPANGGDQVPAEGNAHGASATERPEPVKHPTKAEEDAKTQIPEPEEKQPAEKPHNGADSDALVELGEEVEETLEGDLGESPTTDSASARDDAEVEAAEGAEPSENAEMEEEVIKGAGDAVEKDATAALYLEDFGLLGHASEQQEGAPL